MHARTQRLINHLLLFGFLFALSNQFLIFYHFHYWMSERRRLLRAIFWHIWHISLILVCLAWLLKSWSLGWISNVWLANPLHPLFSERLSIFWLPKSMLLFVTKRKIEIHFSLWVSKKTQYLLSGRTLIGTSIFRINIYIIFNYSQNLCLDLLYIFFWVQNLGGLQFLYFFVWQKVLTNLYLFFIIYRIFVALVCKDILIFESFLGEINTLPLRRMCVCCQMRGRTQLWLFILRVLVRVLLLQRRVSEVVRFNFGQIFGFMFQIWHIQRSVPKICRQLAEETFGYPNFKLNVFRSKPVFLIE